MARWFTEVEDQIRTDLQNALRGQVGAEPGEMVRIGIETYGPQSTRKINLEDLRTMLFAPAISEAELERRVIDAWLPTEAMKARFQNDPDFHHECVQRARSAVQTIGSIMGASRAH